MSLFLKIIKEILHSKIIAIRDMSICADGTPTNTLFTLVGKGRDLSLSAAKRTLLENTLLSQVDNFIDTHNDKTNSDDLQGLIKACRMDAKTKSDDKGYDEGDTGPAIQLLVNLVQLIFEKLTELKLTELPELKVRNKPPVGDPLYAFHYFLAYYCAQKIAADHNPGFFKRIAKSPHVSNSRHLAQAKDALVLAAIDEVDIDIKGLDIQYPDYPQARLKSILSCIDKLRRDNKALCIENTGYVLSFFKLDFGTLETCMENAIKEIQKNPKPRPLAPPVVDNVESGAKAADTDRLATAPPILAPIPAVPIPSDTPNATPTGVQQLSKRQQKKLTGAVAQEGSLASASFSP